VKTYLEDLFHTFEARSIQRIDLKIDYDNHKIIILL